MKSADVETEKRENLLVFKTFKVKTLSALAVRFVSIFLPLRQFKYQTNYHFSN